MICPNCGNDILSDSKTCGYCGHGFETDVLFGNSELFCQACGSSYEVNEQFCPHCGNRVQNTKSKNADKTKEDVTPASDTVENSPQDNKQNPFGTDNFTTEAIKEKWSLLDVFTKSVVVVSGITLLLLLFAIVSQEIGSVVLAVLQLGIAIVAMLIHKGLIKVKVQYVKYIMLAGAVLFAIFTIISFLWTDNYNDDNSENNPPVTLDNYYDDITTENSRKQKNGFDSTVNEKYTVAQYTVEIPQYWQSEETITSGIQRYAETGGKVAMLQITASYDTDENYPVTFDGLMADNENMIKTIESSVFSKVNDYEVIDTGSIKGILYKGEFDAETYDIAGYGEWFIFASEIDRNWCSIILTQSNNTDFLYNDDFKKMIESIRLNEPSSVNTSVPTTELELTTETKSEENVDIILPDSDSKLGKDFESEGKNTIYYINIDGVRNTPSLQQWGSATVTDGVAEYLDFLSERGFTVTIISSDSRSPYEGFTIYETNIKVSNSEISWTMFLSIQDEMYVEYELDVNLH